MLSYTDQIRIYQETVLGAVIPKGESKEAAEYRAQITKSVKETLDAGLMPDVPLDWEGGFE